MLAVLAGMQIRVALRATVGSQYFPSAGHFRDFRSTFPALHGSFGSSLLSYSDYTGLNTERESGGCAHLKIDHFMQCRCVERELLLAAYGKHGQKRFRLRGYC